MNGPLSAGYDFGQALWAALIAINPVVLAIGLLVFVAMVVIVISGWRSNREEDE